MKIAISSMGSSSDSMLSEQFGRCAYFIIADAETMKFEAVSNSGEEAKGGAGPKAAQLIINRGGEVVLTGRVGDKAKEVLEKGGVKIITGFTGSISVKDALISFLGMK